MSCAWGKCAKTVTAQHGTRTTFGLRHERSARRCVRLGADAGAAAAGLVLVDREEHVGTQLGLGGFVIIRGEGGSGGRVFVSSHSGACDVFVRASTQLAELAPRPTRPHWQQQILTLILDSTPRWSKTLATI